MGLPSLNRVRGGLRDLRRDAAITWSYGGVAAIWEALRARSVHWLYRRQVGILFEEDLAMVSRGTPPAGVEIRALSDRDWGPLAQTLTTRGLERIRRRTMPGRTCLIAWRGERPIGHTWLSERGGTPGSVPVPLPSDASYGWDLWVDPRERGRGVGSALAIARLEYARERGRRRVWRVVIPRNRPALRTVEKSSGGSARAIGRVTYVTCLGRRRTRYEPASS